MCNISQLKPGFMIPYEMFRNVVLNNPHGYGILFKDRGKLELAKDCPKNGNDPEKIYKLLEDGKDTERFLHVRWKTEGAIGDENTQPFQVYKRGDKELWFMHNGTLYGYAPNATSSYPRHWSPEEDAKFKEASDSRRFCEFRLKPLLTRLINPETNKLDFDDPVISEVITKFWPAGGYNRAILISNDQDPFYFNLTDWKTIDTPEGKFLSSNDNYFSKLTRGYEYERLEKLRKEKEEKERAERAANNNSSVDGIDLNELAKFNSSLDNLFGHPLFHQTFEVKGEVLKNLWQDWDIYDPDGYTALGNISMGEVTKVVKESSEDDLIMLITCLTSTLADAGEKVTQLTGKLHRASKHIESMKLANINSKLNPQGFTLLEDKRDNKIVCLDNTKIEEKRVG